MVAAQGAIVGWHAPSAAVFGAIDIAQAAKKEAGGPRLFRGNAAPADQRLSKRSRSITLTHAATKSCANFVCASALA